MSKQGLNVGFLIMYEWVPFMENLSAESLKELFSAMIKRQRDGTPFPEFKDKYINFFVPVVEATIQRRLTGQSVALAALEKSEKENAENNRS